jgi:hypothetical protein
MFAGTTILSKSSAVILSILLVSSTIVVTIGLQVEASTLCKNFNRIILHSIITPQIISLNHSTTNTHVPLKP